MFSFFEVFFSDPGDSVLSFVVKTFEGVSIDGNLSLIFKGTGEWCTYCGNMLKIMCIMLCEMNALDTSIVGVMFLNPGAC